MRLITFENDSFDAIHSSHLMQVLALLKHKSSFLNVYVLQKTKDNVLSTLNWFPRFLGILKI